MRKYTFRPISGKDRISVIDMGSHEEAELYFASLKKLPIETFREIYTVEEI